ncbi:MAG: chromosomal replication initiator protein DnaA, partial [Anaerolineae bacterium]|nr:chromosomal replication initiator protein DnaA [Anaerolineae bacterium]
AQKLAEQAIQNVRELEGLLTQVLARAQLAKQPLTLALAQQVLKKQGIEIVAERAPRLSQIFEAAAEYHQLSMDDILSKRRTQKIARARQIAMYLAREVTDASLPQIGEALGGRNHTTVLYGYKKIAAAIDEDDVLRDEVSHIRENLFSKD